MTDEKPRITRSLASMPSAPSGRVDKKPPINDVDAALAAMIALVISSIVVGDAKRRVGFNKALVWLRDSYKEKGSLAGAAMIENVRRNSTGEKSNAAVIEMLKVINEPKGRA